MTMADIGRAREALNCIPADIARPEWVRVGMAAQAAGLDFDDFDTWSATGSTYDARAARDTWRSFKPGEGVGAGSLFRMAAELGGYRVRGKSVNGTQSRVQPRSKPQATKPTPKPGNSPSEVWARCEPATWAHGYVVRKGAAGVPLDGLRVLPAGDSLRIRGESVAGSLAVPGFASDGTLQTLQFIPAQGDKLNLPGCPMAGARFIVGDGDGALHVAEGIASAWAAWQATGARAVCAFGIGNMGRVAADLRQKEPGARLVLLPDVGQESKAEAIAREHGCMVAKLPEGWDSNSDVGDFAAREGLEALAELLESAQAPEPPPLPLDVSFADELPPDFTPPDELLEGVLTVGAASILYGDSNSGKTFTAVDMACAVACGGEWMGRRTERGMVVYLAAESPASVRSRLQAYQQHHGKRVPDFAIVANPVDLFASDADTAAIVQTVRELERRRGKPARLVIGDTLARLSAGANENSGEDMGLVVKRVDAIREQTGAHFLLIHHSGKNAASGARGWSGIRAAVDTELEVTDSPQGRCIEITKQRDLNSKGERIGFRLEPVTLGLTKWGTPATSCIVLAADAPAKAQGKRMGEVEGAVIEYLAGIKVGTRKGDVVKHFAGRYEKGPVYRAMKALVTAAAIHEAAGMVCIAEAAK